MAQPGGAKRQHFQVNYSLGQASRDTVKEAFTNFTNEEDYASVQTPISVRTTYDRDAIPYFHRMRSLTHPSFSKPLFLNRDQSGRIYSAYERPQGQKVFSRWLEGVVDPWEFTETGMFLLGVGSEIRLVLRQIGSGMIALLDRREFHGNLLHGLRISTSGEVMLCNLLVFDGELSTEDFEIGLKKDIWAFRELVQQIECQHRHIPKCRSFDLLLDLCYDAQSLAGKELTDMAFFIYNNAAFFEDEHCISLIFKLWDYVEKNMPLYETLFDFEHGKLDMTGWQTKFKDEENYPQFKPVRELHNHSPTYYDSRADGVFIIHRNGLVHLANYVSGCHTGVSYGMLKQAIHGFVPVLFYLAATSLRAHQASFGKDLVDFLRKGRDSIAF